MSCVMNITAVPVSRLSRSISARISAWIVTSSAVVGSSQIKRRGSQASAMAITTRWRIPPESSWGYWPRRRSGSGMRTMRKSSSARARASGRVIPLCTRSPSVSCLPTVKTGLSEVIGSWKIMPISLPRIVRIRGSDARARSTSPPGRWKRSRPPAISPPPNSTRRIRLSEETDLPDPDSPTTATVSPGAMWKLTSSTPTTTPWPVSNSTRRFSMLTSGAGAGASSMWPPGAGLRDASGAAWAGQTAALAVPWLPPRTPPRVGDPGPPAFLGARAPWRPQPRDARRRRSAMSTPPSPRSAPPSPSRMSPVNAATASAGSAGRVRGSSIRLSAAMPSA